MSTSRRTGRVIAAAMASLALAVATGVATTSSAQSTDTPRALHAAHMSSAMQSNAKAVNLRLVQRNLWSQHMEWTYATVASFVHGSSDLDATMTRLLANQVSLGNSIKPYYGAAAGNQLTRLLKAHINGAVPVLVAAKAGNTADLNAAIAAWNANADQIAAFLATANPNLPAATVKAMLRAHISQTVTYAADMLQGDYATSIRDYDKARVHMLHLADALSGAIVKQFPRQF